MNSNESDIPGKKKKTNSMNAVIQFSQTVIVVAIDVLNISSRE